MAKCDACGNEYDKVFEVVTNGKTSTFDCFECAINTLAPECTSCNTKIIGHGIENEGDFYCCANCARENGVLGAEDRI